MPAIGYDPAVVFKKQAGSLRQVKAVIAAAAVHLGNAVRLLYVSPKDAVARMPAGTFEDLAGIKSDVDENDEKRGPSSATRGTIGTDPVWRPFDRRSTCAFVSVFRPEVITQSLLDFLGRMETDYGLGFNGDTADRDARSAPPAMEEAVRSACAPFPEGALEGLVRSSDDARSAHGAHKDIPPHTTVSWGWACTAWWRCICTTLPQESPLMYNASSPIQFT